MTEAANELAPIPSVGLPLETVKELAKSDFATTFLRLQHGKSRAVEENEPKGIRQGDYLLGGKTRIPAYKEGDGFFCTPTSERATAVLWKGEEKIKESHDEKSKTWQEIVAARNAGDRGAKAGFECLLWMPDYDCYVVLDFLNSAKMEAPAMIAARHARRSVKVSSKPVGKNNTFVPMVELVDEKIVFKQPKPEQTRAALVFFEGYKTVQAAPTVAPGGPRR